MKKGLPAEVEKLYTSCDGYWNNHPKYSPEHWMNDVTDELTRLGYWEWVVEMIRTEICDDDSIS